MLSSHNYASSIKILTVVQNALKGPIKTGRDLAIYNHLTSTSRGNQIGMKTYYSCILLATLASVGLAAEIGDLMCDRHYQKAVMEAIAIKKSCNKATFYDCCQVCVIYLRIMSNFKSWLQ